MEVYQESYLLNFDKNSLKDLATEYKILYSIIFQGVFIKHFFPHTLIHSHTPHIKYFLSTIYKIQSTS